MITPFIVFHRFGSTRQNARGFPTAPKRRGGKDGGELVPSIFPRLRVEIFPFPLTHSFMRGERGKRESQVRSLP